MRVFERYASVLRPDGVRRALIGSVIGRLSLGMTGLGLLLVIEEATGSWASAGFVSACYAVAFAVIAPSRARAADRRGPTRVLLACAVLHPLAFGLLLLLTSRDAPLAAASAAAALIGATVPPLGGVSRALWGEVLEPDLLPAAFSLESVLVELCFVTGPLAVTVLAAVFSPALALGASGAVAAVGAVVLATTGLVRRITPHPGRPAHFAGPLVSPAVRWMLLTVLFIGGAFGATEVGVLAFVEERGHGRAVAGAVLAIWSLGSMLGGLVYGGLHLRTTAARQLPFLTLAVSLGSALPALAPGVVLLTVLVTLYGSTIAPWNACNALLLGAASPRGTVTESFAWMSSMIFAGAAAGTALAGVAVEGSSARGAFLVTAAMGGLTLLASMAGTRQLRLSPAHQ